LGFLSRDFISPLMAVGYRGYRVIAPDGVDAGYPDYPPPDVALILPEHISDLVAFLNHL
jgi:hypothetical protein